VVGVVSERLEVGVVVQAEEHPSVGSADHHVVGFVLGVGPAEDLPHVIVLRVAVHRQVSPADRVEVIEPDRKRGPERRVDVAAEDLFGVHGHQRLQG